MTATKYRRSGQALHSEIGGDVVALQIARGQCFGMTNVTADVWRLLLEERSLDEICAQLLEQYDIDEDSCRNEVGQLIDVMTNEGLIEPVA